ncbi:MAG: macrolide ABC transporter ATP-binding protein [candidate division Zixibacteria bacterium HGW-Zixibacteria-1]|nr:MAG: macrolide ABC transporter ATP-binding protein [candidate division Zixibacteria bacterium HGW-Zixibacteria-1]
MIQMTNIKKIYNTGKIVFEALKGIDLEVKDNEYIAIMGPSGSGKSTLMNLMGCLDTPTEGDYYLGGRKVDSLTANDLAEVRNRQVGFVFQAFNLLPYASAYENVELPLLFSGMRAKDRRKRVTELLARVGLTDKTLNKPTEMSGGEMQRVAIARALGNSPQLILADEPTGNLDTKSGGEIIKIFDELWQAGHTVIVITHDANIANHCQRIIKLKDGSIYNGNGFPARKIESAIIN